MSEVYKLSIEAVTKRFGGFVALEPTSLSIRPGEFLTLLGPSGSGKTTLLMMVAGLLRPDSGSIIINGVEATSRAPYERDIGMIFQSYALFPHLTVFENIAFPLRMRRIAEAEIKRDVERVLDVIQLGHAAQRLPRQLSGGQQQRIALARAVVYRPSIVLMDEPLGALDKKLRDQLQLEIRRLHKELGTTIMYVTHDQLEAMTMSDRVCLMNHGRIEQLAPPEELYKRPCSVFAADFLGEANLLDAVIAGRDGRRLHLRLPGAEQPISVETDSAAEAQACTLMVRPERVEIGAEPSPLRNSVRATVIDVIFGGNLTTLTAALSGGANMTAKILTGAAAPQPGDTVDLSWDIASTVALPARQGTSLQ